MRRHSFIICLVISSHEASSAFDSDQNINKHISECFVSHPPTPHQTMMLTPTLRTFLLLIGISSTLVLGAPLLKANIAERDSTASASVTATGGESKTAISTSNNGVNTGFITDGTTTLQNSGSHSVGVCLDPNDCADADTVDW